MARKTGWILVLLVVVLLMAWFRVYLFGHQARMQADRLLAAGHVDEAVGFYDRTLHMYWPGSPDVAQAITQLKQIALDAQTQSDTGLALHVWRVIRSGLYASRGLYQPYSETVVEAEEAIATLVSHEAADPQAKARHLALLERSDDPARGWSMLALMGFALWIGAAIAFIWRAMTADGRLLSRPALLWTAVFITGYVLWITGLAFA